MWMTIIILHNIVFMLTKLSRVCFVVLFLCVLTLFLSTNLVTFNDYSEL